MTSDARESSAGTPTSACLTPLGRLNCKIQQHENWFRIAVAGGMLGGFSFLLAVGALYIVLNTIKYGWNNDRTHEMVHATSGLLPYFVFLVFGIMLGLWLYSKKKMVRLSMRRTNNHACIDILRIQHRGILVCGIVMISVPFVYLVILVVIGAQVDSSIGLGVPAGVLVAVGLAARRGDVYTCAQCGCPWHDGEALRCPECQLLRVPPYGLCIGERRRSIPLIAAGVLVFFAGIVLYMPDLFI